MADMDEQRFIGAIALLLVGGNDTTRNSMSGLVEQMNKFPDQWERLKADRSLISTAATETIRLQTPICHMRRTVVQDTELGGQKLKAGEEVAHWYNSANSDEAGFTACDHWAVGRRNRRCHV